MAFTAFFRQFFGLCHLSRQEEGPFSNKTTLLGSQKFKNFVSMSVMSADNFSYRTTDFGGPNFIFSYHLTNKEKKIVFKFYSTWMKKREKKMFQVIWINRPIGLVINSSGTWLTALSSIFVLSTDTHIFCCEVCESIWAKLNSYQTFSSRSFVYNIQRFLSNEVSLSFGMSRWHHINTKLTDYSIRISWYLRRYFGSRKNWRRRSQ